MSKLHNKKVNILKKYYKEINNTSFIFEVGDSVSSKKIENAKKSFASGLDSNKVLGFLDLTITDNGKKGYIFTEENVWFKDYFEKTEKIWYDEIESFEMEREEKLKDCDRILVINMKDGTIKKMSSLYLNKTPLMDFFNEIIALDNDSTYSDDLKSVSKIKRKKTYGAVAGGVSAGNYSSVNKVYDEEKFSARQGHGFAAERANNLYDKLTGHDAHIVGDNNSKNGADRIVDGIKIQSKYCATGSRCVKECFDNGGKGNFRYYDSQGVPMQIEVPSDKYSAAVKAMEEKIKKGQVEGVTDPEEAKNIIRKGHFTYKQAQNIAKAGTVESLTYDAVNGVVSATSAFGVTAMISFATLLWSGEDFDIALKQATFSGIKVGGTAFITSILASQLSKAGLNSALVSSSETLVKLMGPKASALLVNAFRSGSNIYGAAAMKSAAKLLRGNVITAGVTIVVLSTFDITDIFRGRISGKQLFKNFSSTATSVAGGTAGWIGGASIGASIGSVVPIIGTTIGGFIGGVVGSVTAGAVAGKATNTLIGNFIEDDAEEMVRIIEKQFRSVAADYLLSRKEAEKSVDALREILNAKELKNMFSSDNRVAYANDLLIPIVEKEVAKRPVISTPPYEKINIALSEILEDISDKINDNKNDAQ